MEMKKNVFKALTTFLIIVLVVVTGCGGGGGPDAAEVEQLLTCIIFPLFCLMPAAALDASGQVLNWEVIPPDDATVLISAVSDSFGNVYSVGYTAGVQAAPGEDGDLDAVVLKHGPDRNLLWSRRFGSRDSERAEEILVNGDGSVRITIVKLQSVESDPYRKERKLYGLLLADSGKVLDCSELGIPDVP